MATGSSREASSSSGLGEDDLGKIYNTLYRVRKSYEPFALQIGVKISDIESVESKHTDPGKCLLEILSIRIKKEDIFTWEDIVEALRSDCVGEGKVADEIQKKYVNPQVKQHEKQPQSDKTKKRNAICIEGGPPLHQDKVSDNHGEGSGRVKRKMHSEKREKVSQKLGRYSARGADQQVELVKEKKGNVQRDESYTHFESERKMERKLRRKKKRAHEKEKSIRVTESADQDNQHNPNPRYKHKLNNELEIESDETESESAEFHRETRKREASAGYVEEKPASFSCKGATTKGRKKEKNSAASAAREQSESEDPEPSSTSNSEEEISEVPPSPEPTRKTMLKARTPKSGLNAEELDVRIKKREVGQRANQKAKQLAYSGKEKYPKKGSKPIERKREREIHSEKKAVAIPLDTASGDSTQEASEDEEWDSDGRSEDEEDRDSEQKSSNEGNEETEHDDESSAAASEEEGKRIAVRSERKEDERKDELSTAKRKMMKKASNAPSKYDIREKSNPDPAEFHRETRKKESSAGYVKDKPESPPCKGAMRKVKKEKNSAASTAREQSESEDELSSASSSEEEIIEVHPSPEPTRKTMPKARTPKSGLNAEELDVRIKKREEGQRANQKAKKLAYSGKEKYPKKGSKPIVRKREGEIHSEKKAVAKPLDTASGVSTHKEGSEDEERDLDGRSEDEEDRDSEQKSLNEGNEEMEHDDESSTVASEEEGKKIVVQSERKEEERKEELSTTKRKMMKNDPAAPSRYNIREESNPDHRGRSRGVKKRKKKHKESSMSQLARGSASLSASPEETPKTPGSRRQRKKTSRGSRDKRKEKRKRRGEGLISFSETDDSSSPECDNMARKLTEIEAKNILKVFKRFFGKLCCAILNPVEIAAQLQEKHLISQDTMIDMLRSPESQQDKTIVLLSKLSKRIDSRPYRLYRFLEVLLGNNALKGAGREIMIETGKVCPERTAARFPSQLPSTESSVFSVKGNGGDVKKTTAENISQPAATLVSGVSGDMSLPLEVSRSVPQPAGLSPVLAKYKQYPSSSRQVPSHPRCSLH